MSTTLECSNIQILEPDGDVGVGIAGASDPALTERGEVVLGDGQSEVVVTFSTPKLSSTYRFEYLYVDDFGVTQPGVISAVPVLQTTLGFTVELAGKPIGVGYVLRWRVVVVAASIPPIPGVDVPENIYVNLPQNTVFTFQFQNPRSTQTYGFSELRVENLIDLPGSQVPIAIQVVAKLKTAFSIILSPPPNNSNYYLVARTP